MDKNENRIKVRDGANWNQHDDGFTQAFHEQNLSQFWRAEDISLQGDLNSWATLSDAQKTAYNKILAVLTFLDTYQGDVGMVVISKSMPDHHHQRKAVLNFMAMVENAIHAKSYSTIFTTFLTNDEITELFDWGKINPQLQKTLDIIVGYYDGLANTPRDQADFSVAQWKALVASVFLETWIFYTGFYYPLYFYGQGKLMQAGEIINLIIRDEAVHGLYTGLLAQELFKEFDQETSDDCLKWLYEVMDDITAEQIVLIDEIYSEVGLTQDVKTFFRYNGNKALMNLGLDPRYPDTAEDVNPVIINGLNTETKTMDNFSMKGNGYQKPKAEALSDDDYSDL